MFDVQIQSGGAAILPIGTTIAMPPPRRALRPTPSCANDISPFQTKLLSDLKQLDEQLAEQRVPFLTWAVGLSSSIAADTERVATEISRLREVVFGDTAETKGYGDGD